MYHVVCRDCTHELLATEDASAKREAARHEAERNHRVVVGRID
jgi:hypothetical protein